MTTKSGLRKLAPSEILFNDGELASSLFIIQKGQLRLFKPKGKGFVEVAVLRAGEVIGEMSYFDQEGGRKRSCSAEAMIQTEVIEIGFQAFSKTMENLNPWFKTIINTLVDRLRIANNRVRELESNSTSVNYGGAKNAQYTFLKPIDVLKILATLFTVFKSHAEEIEAGIFKLSKKTLELYFHDVYSIHDVKYEMILFILEELSITDNTDDEIILKDMPRLKELFIFYQTQKHLPEDKKLFISFKTQAILEEIYQRGEDKKVDTESEKISISAEGLPGAENLEDAIEQKFVDPIVLDSNGEKKITVDFKKLRKFMPMIKFVNEVEKKNREKGA